MSKEKRNYYRSNFQIKKTSNVIYLKFKHTSQSISGAFDLSNYGLGVQCYGLGTQCNQPITIETPVTIELKAFELHLSVHGAARWCTPVDGQKNQYRLGIEFDSTHPQDNKLFSFALQRYLKTAMKAS
ncbi:MAG: hypothetical protein L3J70_05925 [Gammaproteobacteria bacterium]|nr:hypothetical protein [Gammaproteobacteria bacterium]